MTDRDHPGLDEAATALRRIAVALGVPVGALTDTLESDVDDMLALLQVWSRIEDPQARRRVLDLARQEAERDRRGRPSSVVTVAP